MSVTQPLLAERYRLVRSLGQGGMGRVWLARDEVLHRDVAIKEVIPPEGLTAEERDEMRRRTLREARAAARLNHPSVVRVYDVVRTDVHPWIVMEYVPSRSLHEVISEDGTLPPSRVAAIGLQVLGALRAAHRAGVLHRDVKPSNVLLTDDGRVVLTDFGLATMPGEATVTRPGMVLGSPAYISPERAREGYAGPESDLWSLGATLYAAVEGNSPYQRSTAIETLTALVTEEAPPAKRAGPLRPVLNGLLRKDPHARMGAEEAERLLRRAAGGGLASRLWLVPKPRPAANRPSSVPPPPQAGTPGSVPGTRVAGRAAANGPSAVGPTGNAAAAAGAAAASARAAARRPSPAAPSPAGPGSHTPGTGTPGSQTPGSQTPGTGTPSSATAGAQTPGSGTSGPQTPGSGTSGSGASGSAPVGRVSRSAVPPAPAEPGGSRGRAAVPAPAQPSRAAETPADAPAAASGSPAAVPANYEDATRAMPPSESATRPAPEPGAERTTVIRADELHRSAPPPARPPSAPAVSGETAAPGGATTGLPDEAPAQAETPTVPARRAVEAASAGSAAAGHDAGDDAPGHEADGHDADDAAGREAAGGEAAGQGVAAAAGSAVAAAARASGDRRPSDDGDGASGRDTGDATGAREPSATAAGADPSTASVSPAVGPGNVDRSLITQSRIWRQRAPMFGGTEADGTDPYSRPSTVAVQPATEAPEQPAGPAGRVAASVRARPKLWLIAAGVVVLAMIVATLALVPDGSRSTTARPGATRTGAAGTSPAPAAPAIPSSGTTTATSSTGAAAPTPGSNTPQLPSGWQMYSDPTGFSVAAPTGWNVTHEGSILYFREPGGVRILGIDQSSHPHMDPVADWRTQRDYRVPHGDFPGYQEIGIRHVDYFVTCADWEFTYDRGGGRTHVINRGFVTSDHQAYGIWWSTPDATWQQDYPLFQLITSTFKPAP